MAFATATFAGDGIETQWSINFSGGYISEDHVKATLISPAGVESEQEFTFVSPTLLQVLPAVPVGWSIKFYRDTPKEEPLVNFTDGAIVGEANLDKSAQQAIFAVAEMVDQFVEVDLLVATAAEDAAFSASEAEAAQVAAAASAASANAAEAAASGSAAAAAASAIEAGAIAVHASLEGNPHNASATDLAYPTTGETITIALDSRTPEIASYAALRAYSGALTAYYVRGVASVLDGGAGVFRVDAADVTSADDGGAILVDASGRRWKREFVGPVNVLWFATLITDKPTPSDQSTWDWSPAFAAAMTHGAGIGRVCYAPQGAYRLKTQIHLYDTNYLNSYGIEGAGKYSTVIYIDDAIGTDCAIEVNRDSVGTVSALVGSHPRLTLARLSLRGDVGSTAGQGAVALIGTTGAGVSVVCNYVYFRDLHNAVRTSGYCDLSTFRHCTGQAMQQTTSVIYSQTANGDCVKFESCFFAGEKGGGARIEETLAATFINCIGGKFTFIGCQNVAVQDCHNETQADSAAKYLIDGSSVVFKNSYLGHVRGLTGVGGLVVIDDVSNYRPASDVVFEDVTFSWSANGELINPANIADVYIKTSTGRTRLRFKGCRRQHWISGRSTIEYTGPKLRALDGTLNALLTSAKAALFGATAVLHRQNNAWRIDADESVIGLTSVIVQPSAPTITAAENTEGAASTLAATTYYYAVQVYDYYGAARRAAATDDITITQAGYNAALSILPQTGPTMMRIWRGTAPATYDRYADIPMINAGTVEVFDVGYAIQGFEWITTGVPAVGSADSVFDKLDFNGHKVLWGTLAPLNGTWALGDTVYNTAPALGGGWATKVCVTAGTPGTWRVASYVTGKGTTASRPTGLTAQDTGLLYLDTTLAAAGKPIWWGGGSWVDATGASV